MTEFATAILQSLHKRRMLEDQSIDYILQTICCACIGNHVETLWQTWLPHEMLVATANSLLILSFRTADLEKMAKTFVVTKKTKLFNGRS